MKSGSDSDNEHSYSEYQTAAKHIKAWALRNPLVRFSQITPDALDQWKGGWKLETKHPDNRMERRQRADGLKEKGLLANCAKMRWIIKSPAAAASYVQSTFPIWTFWC